MNGTLHNTVKMKWRNLCNITAVFQGVWEFISNPTPEMEASMLDPWKYCPQTKQLILNSKHVPFQDLTYQLYNYSCFNRPYRYAHYVHQDCYFNPSKTSLRKIDSAAHQSYDLSTHLHPGIEAESSPPSHSLVQSSSVSTTAPRWLSVSSVHEGHALEHQHLPQSQQHHHQKQQHQLRRNHIYYVGDSLSAQMYIAGQCMMEELGYNKEFNLTWIPELFLRHDIPCQDQCINNPSLYSKHKELHNPCSGCPEGKRITFDYMKIPGYWYNRITNDTMAMVIGSGAWYNGHKGIINSDIVYEETMKMIAPMIQDLIQNRNIPVFWLGLPPNGNDTVNIFYEWSRYRNKDNLARKHLEPLGVIFLDNMLLANQRKRADPHLNPDDFHWW